EGRIFYANRAYEELLGVPVNKVVGRNIFKIEPESDLCIAIREQRSIVNSSKYIKSVDKYVSLRIQVLPEDIQSGGAVSLFTDVTKIESLNTEIERMSGMVDVFRQQERRNYQRSGIITRNRQFLQLLDQASIAARTNVPVLLRGENGVGKEVVARYIHMTSERSDQPLVVVNCSAIPESLIESELFGYEEGAFTGAKKGGKMGKFELANHGTIFLDEIGDMPVSLQARLLRVIQNGEIEKIGRQRTIPVDARIIAATNQPLEDMIAGKMFRKDLFFRLNVISLTIPPLRDRREDIPLLADHFLKEYNRKYKRSRIIPPQGYHRLLQNDWSGNVRELQNCIERAVILSISDELSFSDLLMISGSRTKPFSDGAAKKTTGLSTYSILDDEYRRTLPLSEQVALFEAQIIKTVMQEEGDKEKAIERLGISKRTFYRKCAQYKMNEKE
ncbi:MAG: sigma 54-interacting transcriptional regulator, partial [Eubacterium sp.]|nr:sigma 54-interacting transcriptional regulator [Eubacterium sp.]